MAASTLLCLFSITQLYTQTNNYYSSPKREMRGIWIATVNNIDWPSQPNLPVDKLKRETDIILDRVKNIGLNTVFVQVRPSSDAIYRSQYEPFTTYLVDENSTLPADFDPLEYWIAQAHSRGLELHAWINPFRMTPKKDFACAPLHPSRTHQNWAVTYAGKMYLDPGIPDARQYVQTIVDDIASRYDIDGIHIDDYFYPYPVAGEPDFADTASYRKYNPSKLSLGDWRRENVNDVICRISQSVKQIKPWIAFGVSPFGVWRNKRDDPTGSDTRAGTTNYDILYADVAKWIDNKWIDYVAPQIYWEQGHSAADFDKLTEWWAERSKGKTQVYVGHAIFKVNTGAKAWDNPEEIPTQIAKVREHTDLDGSIFFSYRQFNRDLLGLEKKMQTTIFTNKSLTPLTLPNKYPKNIEVSDLEHKRGKLHWDVNDASDVRFYAVYRYKKGDDFDTNKSNYLYELTDQQSITLEPSNKKKRTKYIYCVSAIDKYREEHNLSHRISIRY